MKQMFMQVCGHIRIQFYSLLSHVFCIISVPACFLRVLLVWAFLVAWILFHLRMVTFIMQA